MFDSKKKKKIYKLFFIIVIILLLVITVGILGYRHFFGMSWSDAVYNATITASTLGLETRDRTTSEKIFTGFYSIISGIFVISLISSIIAYVFTVVYGEDD